MEIQNETILDHKQMFDVAIKQKICKYFVMLVSHYFCFQYPR